MFVYVSVCTGVCVLNACVCYAPYVCGFLNAFMQMCVFVYVHVFLSECTWVCVYVCAYRCADVTVFVCACVSLHVYVCIFTYKCVHTVHVLCVLGWVCVVVGVDQELGDFCSCHSCHHPCFRGAACSLNTGALAVWQLEVKLLLVLLSSEVPPPNFSNLTLSFSALILCSSKQPCFETCFFLQLVFRRHI